MKLKFALALVSLLPLLSYAPDASAQAAYQSQGATGVYGRTSYQTNNLGRSDALTTSRQALGSLPATAGFGGLTKIVGPRGRNGLPPTKLDSFVKTSGYNFHIYGDEGVTLPPMFEFTPASRIQRGNLSNGLSTGHGSSLAPGWGGDEYVDYEGLSQSGPNGGSNNNWKRSLYQFGLQRADMAGNPGALGGTTPAPSMPNPTQTVPHNSGAGNFGFSFP